MASGKSLVTTHASGKEVYKVKLGNKNGTEVTLTNYGNIVSSFIVKGINIVLGFDDIEKYFSKEYLSAYPYFGAVIGRTGNRIQNGRFEIDGKEYQLAQNNGPHNLHGGPNGFDQQVWEIDEEISEAAKSVCFRYTSKDGEEGFPGNLSVKQVYTLTDGDELVIESFATTDAPTLINLTHHDYFNLNGKGSIEQHFVRIYADNYLGQDAGYGADGRVIPVLNTVYDFRAEKILQKEGGYDQSFLVNNYTHHLQAAAEATGNETGLHLTVFTTEPVVHLYTGGGIPEMVINGEKKFGHFSGFCFETQKEPNAINVPHFSNTVLRPGETYREKTIYRVL